MGVEVKVTDSGATGVVKRLAGLAQSLTIGVHDDADPYPNGTDVAVVGAVHEFGSAEVPQRSFLRGWIDSGGQSVVGNVGEEAIGKVVDGADTKLITKDIGEASVEGITKRMDAGIFPPLSPATLANPARDQRGIPLEDTERLRDSIKFEAVT